MSTSYKIRLKRFNGTDYDTLNLVSQNVIMSSGNDLQTDFTNLDNSIDDIVYVGGTTPTDPDTKIWLDTDSGGASAVNSINGKAGNVILDADDVGAMAEWDLLWTNASPTSAFAAQTIQCDTGYDAYAIVYIGHTSAPAQKLTVLLVESDCQLSFIAGSTGMTTGRIFMTIRQATKAVDGISFGSDYGCAADGSWYAYNHSGIVPYKIYGIKGVQTS